MYACLKGWTWRTPQTKHVLPIRHSILFILEEPTKWNSTKSKIVLFNMRISCVLMSISFFKILATNRYFHTQNLIIKINFIRLSQSGALFLYFIGASWPVVAAFLMSTRICCLLYILAKARKRPTGTSFTANIRLLAARWRISGNWDFLRTKFISFCFFKKV